MQSAEISVQISSRVRDGSAHNVLGTGFFSAKNVYRTWYSKNIQTIINSTIHRTLSETLSCAAVRAPHQTVRSPSRHVQCYDTLRRTSTGAHLPFPARREWCPALTHPVTGAAPPPDTCPQTSLQGCTLEPGSHFCIAATSPNHATHK